MAKILIGSELGSYSFNKTAKTITFSGFAATLERLLLITDTTNNTIIYQFNDPLKGGTLANNVLTLTFDTTGVSFANTDSLQIFYWSEEPQQTAVLDLAMSIKRDLQMIRREPNMSPAGMNVNVNGGTLPSVTTVTTVSTVSTVTTVSTVSQLNYFGASTEGAYTLLTNRIFLSDNWQSYKNKIIT